MSKTHVQLETPTPPTPAEIRAFCARHELRQSDLASCLGVMLPTVHRWVAGTSTPPAYLSLALRTLETDLRCAPLIILQNVRFGRKLKRFDIDELAPGLIVGDAHNKYARGEILRVSAFGGRCLVRWTAHDGTIHESRRGASGLKRLPQ